MASVDFQSQEHRDLLDSIDKLRSRGISRYIGLPEIIVCGDQSSGKSSVLEAISGMSFPTKDNLCTRFATELVLRRNISPAAKVSINPGPDRSTKEQERLRSFGVEIDIAKPEIEAVIEKAKEAMGLSDARVFSKDILRVELSGPSQPHLTLVDLPGLFRAGNSDQSVDDAEIVKDMVQRYMKRPRSIIIAVVSAKNDLALQEITELTKELDPNGARTLGLITKPDTLDAGSDSEAAFFKLAQNKNIVFRLGWHVLRNRDYRTRNSTTIERDEAERTFFSSGLWANMDPNCLGVKTLKPRLSNILKNQILRQLPSLLHDVDLEIAVTKNRLERLGAQRATPSEQRKFLLQASRDFTALMKAAIDGNYKDRFFGSAKTKEGSGRRLRALVQNTLTEFEGTMRSEGHARVIVETQNYDEEVEEAVSPRRVSRSDYIDEVKDLMKKSRGCELPGTFNPLVIGELFAEQCEPWERIVKDLETKILGKVNQVVQAIVSHVSVDETAGGISCIIDRALDPLKNALDLKIKELLAPHFDGHPITFNHYLTNTVQKMQAQRRRRRLEEIFEKIIGDDFNSGSKYSVNTKYLFEWLAEGIENDMERYGSELAADYTLAYYKVARKKFVDDVGVLAVEHCLISKLPGLFSSDVVYELGDSKISELAAESTTTAAERKRCEEKLAILEAGFEDLNRLRSHQSFPEEPQLQTPDMRDVDNGYEESSVDEDLNGNLSDVHSNFSLEDLQQG